MLQCFSPVSLQTFNYCCEFAVLMKWAGWVEDKKGRESLIEKGTRDIIGQF